MILKKRILYLEINRQIKKKICSKLVFNLVNNNRVKLKQKDIINKNKKILSQIQKDTIQTLSFLQNQNNKLHKEIKLDKIQYLIYHI